ncbi:MAG: hypothetical protein U1A78_08715 [Polyangia bacterium]
MTRAQGIRSLLAVTLVGALVAIAVAVGGGCSRDESSRSDDLMLVQLAEARAWQRRADLHLADGDINAAIADVQEVLAIRFPTGSAEGEDVLLDAHARLARLYLSQSSGASGGGSEEAEQRALAQVEAGRKLTSRESFFRAHLESVAADVFEARARRLTDPAAQKQARKEAIGALERAIAIDRALQRSLLNLREAPRAEPMGAAPRAEPMGAAPRAEPAK